MKKIISVVLLLISLSHLGAQTADSVTKVNSHAQLKIGLYYNSALNYYGRIDSLRSSGFFPLVELWFGKGFYLNVAPVFVHNTLQSFQYAGSVATAGYLARSKNKKWLINFYIVKPFYRKSTELVQSALKAQGAFSVTSVNNLLNVTGGADIKFTDKTDIGITAGLDHIFRIPLANQSTIVIDPSAVLYAGTQQFTNTYYRETKFLFLPETQQALSANEKRFNILSYEVSLPVIFTKGKFQALLTPAYVIPENLLSLSGRPDLSERGRKMFYGTVGVRVGL